jgi:hypothetical protein
VLAEQHATELGELVKAVLEDAENRLPVWDGERAHIDLSPLYAAVIALMAVRKMPAEMDEVAIY